MQNILYLDDCINLYNKRINKIIVFKPYKNTLENGIIIDRKKFIKVFNKLLLKNKLKRNLLQESIIVIINGIYTKENKKALKEILNELNYNRVSFVNEKNCLNLNNTNIYINYNNNYFLISYKENNERIFAVYKKNNTNNELILNIINKRKKEKVFIYGKDSKKLFYELKSNKNCYIYSDADNLLLKILISKLIKL